MNIRNTALKKSVEEYQPLDSLKAALHCVTLILSWVSQYLTRHHTKAGGHSAQGSLRPLNSMACLGRIIAQPHCARAHGYKDYACTYFQVELHPAAMGTV